MLAVAEYAQALEIDHLLRDLLGRVGAAFCLHVVAAELAAIGLFDLVFDRQAMAIPARHIHRVIARKLAGFGDHVLEDFVDRVADMDLAIGIGRSVV
ncbi:hypothetical protein GALL_465740 [mine drainage metagenome]|uniref:Uncharacterized protein n=1 Tax=mine drainage metagenome TaxID=410659 RepID=A0A1J5PJX0_9ZZZZ